MQTNSLRDYRITEKIYHGSHSVIHRAVNQLTDERVLIKQLLVNHVSSNASPNYYENVFIKEYHMGRFLASKNPQFVTRYLDLVTNQFQSSHAIVIEDFGAVDLEQIIPEKGFELQEFLEIAIQIVHGLSEIHRFNAIHRDIKPRNILINVETRQVKITDFGSMVLLPEDNSTFSQCDGQMSLSYAAPESTGRINRASDQRTDFYSLGITFFQMLTGKLPFTAADTIELIHCHIAKEPPHLIDIRPDIPRPVANIVHKLMKKNAEDRYQSVSGLLYDLTTCLDILKLHGMVLPFEIGANDVSDKLILSNDLYGREKELETLMTSFARVCDGTLELFIISGKEGIGKSYLVQEMQKQIQYTRNAYFLQGRFEDQVGSYTAIAQALQSFVRQVLVESDQQIEVWKRVICSALQTNAQVIIDLVPSLEKLIGKQQPAAIIGSVEAQNRFHLTFLKFLRAISTATRPVVLFLDEMHLCDTSSWELLQYVAKDPELKHLLVIAAIKEPVSPTVTTAIDEIKQVVPCHVMELTSLTFENIHKWLCISMKLPEKETYALAAICFQKTGGNPFFARMFIRSIYNEHLVYYQSGRWIISIDKIALHCPTENVIDMMAHKINQVTGHSREVINLVSCFGDSVQLQIIQLLAKAKMEQLLRYILRPILDLGYAYIVEQEPYFEFRWYHDKIRESVYSLLEPEEKQRLHLYIGKTLLRAHRDKIGIMVDLFDIVCHLNKAIDLIMNVEHSSESHIAELRECIELNLLAAQKAELSVAHATALQHLKCAAVYLDGIGDRFAEENRDLTFRLYKFLGKQYYLCGIPEEAKKCLDFLLQHSTCSLDTAEILVLRLERETIRSEFTNAIQTGMQALELMGIKLSRDEYQSTIERESLRVKQHMHQLKEDWKREQTVQSFTDYWINSLKSEENPEKALISKIISTMLFAVYMTDPQLYSVVLLLGVELTFEGCLRDAGQFYGSYASVISMSTDDEVSELCKEFGRFAIQYSNGFSIPERAKSVHSYLILVHHWFNHIASSVQLSLDSYKSALVNGENSMAGVLRAYAFVALLFRGDPINQIVADINESVEFFITTNNLPCRDLAWIYATVGKKFTGDTTQHVDTLYHNRSEEEIVSGLTVYLQAHYYVLRAIFAVYLDNQSYESAYKMILEANQYIQYLNAHYLVAPFIFFHSIAILRLLQSKISGYNEAELLKQVETNQSRLLFWSNRCPENFEDKYLLVEAERRKLSGDWDAAKFYEGAIEQAAKHGFLHEYALANELSAQFWMSKGLPSIAKGRIERSIIAYRKWGAKCKFKILRENYSHVLNTTDHRISDNIYKYAESGNTLTDNLSIHSDSSSTEITNLDMASIIKSSNIICGSIDMEKSLTNIMEIIIETAGAEHGCIVIDNRVEAEYYSVDEVPTIRTLRSIPISEWKFGCKAIIEYVSRSLESLVFGDALKECWIPSSQEYIRKHSCKSILCMPIVQRQELRAILYVENNLTSDAFTDDRVKTLSVLTGQMAISLENAKIFKAHLSAAQEIANIQKERALEAERNRKMQEDYIDRISHELRNPIHGVLGQLELLRSQLQLIKTELGEKTEKLSFASVFEGLDDIETCIMHQKVITDDVLLVSKLETERVALKSEPVNPKQLLLSCIRNQKYEFDKKGIHVTTRVPDEELTVSADSTRLRQIILNLLTNATKYNVLNGSISIELHIEKLEMNRAKITFRVEDTGIGMTRHQLETLFNRYERTSKRPNPVYEGSGLGMIISSELVKLMGGHMHAQSEGEGKGSIFTMWLICELIKEEVKLHEPIIEQSAIPHYRILVVEDNLINQKVLAKMLESAGHHCKFANNGLEAIEAYRTEQLDLILMDIEMPLCNGLTATKMIRDIEAQTATKPISIIGVSGNAREENISNAMAAGMNDYLTKPVKKHDILQRIQEQVERTKGVGLY